MGFKIENAIAYISDVSHIPDEAWELLESNGPPAIFVLDCLRMHPHTSHFGLSQAMAAVRRLRAQRSYFVGFTHDLTHEQYTEILRAVGEGKGCKSPSDESDIVRIAFDVAGEGEPQFVRPAYDGLQLSISSSGLISGD